MRTSCLPPGSMANHLVILAPVSSSDAFSWRVVQSEGSKAWTREIRSRNLVSAAGPEVSSQWQTNSVPTSLEAGLAAFLTTQPLAGTWGTTFGAAVFGPGGCFTR